MRLSTYLIIILVMTMMMRCIDTDVNDDGYNVLMMLVDDDEDDGHTRLAGRSTQDMIYTSSKRSSEQWSRSNIKASASMERSKYIRAIVGSIHHRSSDFIRK